MKVLHVISSVDSRGGGPAMAMAGLCKAQRGAGLDVSAVSSFRRGEGRDIADDLSAAGVNVTVIGPTRGPLSAHRQLRPTVRALIANSDVVHVHALWEQIQHVACVAARDLGKPYVVTPHGMLTPWSLRQGRLKKQIYLALRMRRNLNAAAALHFTSAAERDATAAAIKLKPPAIVETLGIDLSEFATLPPPGSFRAAQPRIGERKIILFLGRLHPGKGMEYLIPALRRMKRTDTVLVAVGPDSENFQAHLQRLCVENGVEDRVIFTGMLRGRDRLEALTDADIFALPSEHENFGIVVVEALACGTPVIVSDGVALHAEVSAAKVGSTVRVGDIAGLAAELDRWLSDSALHQAAKERARDFASKQFDWSKIALRWRDHYRALKEH